MVKQTKQTTVKEMGKQSVISYRPTCVVRCIGCCLSTIKMYVTYHDFTRTYHGLISSYITLLTYFCVYGTVPTSTHCTALPWWAGGLSSITSRFHGFSIWLAEDA